MEDHRITETDIWAYVSGNADGETTRRVELWKQSKAYDPKWFEDLAQMYQLTGEMPQEEPNVQNAKLKFFKAVEGPGMGRSRFLREFVKYAAAIVLLASGIYFLYDPSEKIVVQTTFGEQKEVHLPDGTQIWLNASSRLSYETASPRKMLLEGEAFFKVVKNEKVPFTVDTHDGIKIKVLGTSFNVKSYRQKEYTETVLLEGKVELSSRNFPNKVEMSPNDKILFLGRERKLVRSTVAKPNELIAWKDGALHFSDKPFWEIAADLEIQRNIKIKFKNDEIATSHFTGSFEAGTSIGEILETLRSTKPFKYQQSADGDWIVE
ncbi:MAG: FecR family protein [Flavobacteriaceae bacterium]